MKDYKYINVSIENGAGYIEFNRPEVLNCLNRTMCEEICHAIEKLGSFREINCLVMTGKGRGFCAGWDVQDMGEGEKRNIIEVSDDMQAVTNLCTKIINCPKIVICAVNGITSGGGCGIVLASDFIIAHEKSKFAFPFIQVGFVQDTGLSYLLPKIVGMHKAKELLMLGKSLTALEALQMGLINTVVADQDFSKTINDCVVNLTNKSQAALSSMKKLLNYNYDKLLQFLEQENKAQTILTQTEEHLQFVTTFHKNKKIIDSRN